MRKIISMIVLSLFFISVSAEYNPDKEYNSDGINTKMITTTSLKTMHQSWDLDLDGQNDCEFYATCDHTIDYTSAKTYLDKNEFLKAEGQICEEATDGCNSIYIENGDFGVMTEMICENIEYSCKSYDEEKIEKMKYIRKNISSLTSEKATLGGTWYVTDINWKSDNEIIVSYEDGHVVSKVILTLSDLEQTKEDDVRVCTMQYAPVCAAVQVQCIMAPCYPVEQTFGNSCMAADNKVLYSGECNNYVKFDLYDKFVEKTDKVNNILVKFSDEKLEKMLELIDKKIEVTKLMKIRQEVQQEFITAYVFLKDLINLELGSRK